MVTMKSALAAVGLFGGLILAGGSASALPAGPAGLGAADAPIVNVQMTRGERMMQRRTMRRRMMRHEMRHDRRMHRRMMHRRMMRRM